MPRHVAVVGARFTCQRHDPASRRDTPAEHIGRSSEQVIGAHPLARIGELVDVSENGVNLPDVLNAKPSDVLMVVLGAPGTTNVDPPGPSIGEVGMHAKLQLVAVLRVELAHG